MAADEEKVSPGAPTRAARRRLGEVLVEQAAITEEQLEAALEAQREAARARRRVRLGALVVEMGFATDRQVAAALAGALSLDLVDLGTITLQQDVARLLPRSVAERHLVVPHRARRRRASDAGLRRTRRTSSRSTT